MTGREGVRRAGRPWPDATQALLLRAATGTGETAARAYDAWRAAIDLDTIDGGSFRILPLLYRNLARQGLADGDPLVARLKGIYRLSWVRNRTALALVEGVVGRLRDHGIDAQLLKGSALTLRHYRDFGVRWMDDCDLLVRPEEAPEAMDILQRRGWQPAIPRPERIIPAIQAVNFKDDDGNSVDLHWRPLWECCHPGDDALYWEAAVPARLGERAVAVPAPADLLLYSCIHGLRWHLPPTIYWIADALTVLRDAGDGLDWDRFVALARRLWLTVPAHAALAHLRRHWDAPIPEGVLGALRATPVPPTLRLEYVVKLGPQRFWPKVFTQWSHARRAVGYPHAGRAFLALPTRLQHLWQLERLGELPGRALAVAGRRLTGRNRSVA